MCAGGRRARGRARTGSPTSASRPGPCDEVRRVVAGAAADPLRPVRPLVRRQRPAEDAGVQRRHADLAARGGDHPVVLAHRHPARRGPVEQPPRAARSPPGAGSARSSPPGPVHFAWSNLEETFEDLMTVGYLADTAHQAGLDVRVAADARHRLGRAALPRQRRRPDQHDLQALPVGVDAGRAVRAARARRRAPRPPGWSRRGSCCCRTRRCWRCSGSSTRGTSCCCRHTWTGPRD